MCQSNSPSIRYPAEALAPVVRHRITNPFYDGFSAVPAAIYPSRALRLTTHSTIDQGCIDRAANFAAKRRVLRKYTPPPKRFKPQFGFETLEAHRFIIEALAPGTSANITDTLVKEVEGVIALLVSITKSSDMLGVASSIFLYVRNKFDTSISKILIAYISDLMHLTPQDGVEHDPTDPEPKDEPTWLSFIRNLRTNWKTCVASGLFANFSKVLSVLVVSGLARSSDLCFTMGGFKMIEPDLKVIASGATDLGSSICDLVIFFTERCYHSWKSGSFRPFFAASLESCELEVSYATLQNNWDLYRNGNLAKIAKVSEHDFLTSLEDMGTKLKRMLATAKGIDKKLLEDKYRNIIKIIGNFSLIKVNSGFKRSPFAIEYFGLSSVGKSTISEQVCHYLFCSSGLSIEEGRKYVHVSGKKHWDGARTDMLELKLDDHANTKSAFVESSPCDVIIKVCNNVPYSPPMADLGEKGKVWIEPELVTLTTNLQDLDARLYSNHPISVQRRMHYIVEVRVKKRFQMLEGDTPYGMDTDRVMAYYTNDNGEYEPPLYQDVWEVDIKIAVPGVSPAASGTYVIVEHDGHLLQGISNIEACNFLNTKFREHRKKQNDMFNAQAKKIVAAICSADGCFQISGFCTAHMCKQFGIENPLLYRRTVAIRDPEYIAETQTILAQARTVYDNLDWVPYVPERYLYSDTFSWIYSYANRYEFVDNYKYYTFINACWHALCYCCVGQLSVPVSIACGTFVAVVMSFLFLQVWLVTFVREALVARLRDRHVLTEVQRAWSGGLLKDIMSASFVLGGLYTISKAYKSYRSFNVQGSLIPSNSSAVESRDGEHNVWCAVAPRSLPISDISQRMSTEQLENVISKSLVYGTVHRDGDNGMVNGLMVASNVMLLPHHYFDQFGSKLSCTFRKRNPEASGGKFNADISLSASYLIPNTDLRACYVPTGGSYKNIVELFPTSALPSVPFKMLWRKRDGDIIRASGLSKPGVVTTYKSFVGGNYQNLTMQTFEGLCGATLISDTVGSSIIGIHLGGISQTDRGCYGSVTQQELFMAMGILRDMEGTILSGSDGIFNTTVLGVQVVNHEPLHYKSPLNYMPPDSQIEYYGTCPGRAMINSTVRVTPISPMIIDVCGVPNTFHGPKLKPDWFGWQACLANVAVPARSFDHDLLVMAVKDYKEPLLEICKSPLWKSSTPLSDHDNLCGVPGKKFMDAIKLNTSVGFPLTGPKRNYVHELEPLPEWPVNRVLHDELMTEINRIEDCYKRGERGYPIAKACKKDEILDKEKCRIFYSNALSLTFLIRKYYLPMLRILQMNPLVSECAVGINSHGPEWEEMHQHATKFGMDRLFGGDYGKYDQKLPSQLIFASLRVLIDCASQCGYSEEDLNVMEAMTADIVYAYIAYNGDLIGLTTGTHISGNSLTVIINGICGSLNLRCFFYTVYPSLTFAERRKFRDWVAGLTYGDDNLGSVREGADKFTIKGISKFLARYGQTYTMPDKTSELLDFLPKEDFEFLKRASVYHPKLGGHVGALVDKSIYKSLHCFMRPKNCVDTEEYACALNIDGALREWFNHGEEKYEKQRVMMKDVANRAGISHMCVGLDDSYDDRVEVWKETYMSTQSGFEVPELTYEELYGAPIEETHPMLHKLVYNIVLVGIPLYFYLKWVFKTFAKYMYDCLEMDVYSWAHWKDLYIALRR